ncbi:MAG: enzyme of heme biosynthesis [Tidjanibacter sp.]|nr:enzyme of heme biosynthesis [Tidjanibacter sp.]
MKKSLIRFALVLTLVGAGSATYNELSAQTTETVDAKTAAKLEKERQKAEKARLKAEAKAEKERLKAEAAEAKQREKIQKIIEQQAKEAARNGQAQEQTAQQNTTFGPEWGENATPEERMANVQTFNFYNDAYNNKDFDKALKYLDELLVKCPKARSNIYVYGTNIYKNKIARSRTLDDRNAYVDSLMMLYDQRLVNFGDDEKYGRSYILKRKASDYYNFKSDDKQGMLKLFKQAIEADNEVDSEFINQYFMVLTEEYQALNVETDYYMNEYDVLSDKLAKIDNDEAKNSFDALFLSSGAANCDNLETVFKSHLAANPNDEVQIAKAFKFLSKNECRTPFFFTVADNYFALNPTATVAIVIKKAYESVGDNAKALSYLRAAFDREKDQIEKAKLAVEIAGTELAANNARAAADYAHQAMKLNPDSGLAYICLAQAYVTGTSACADFEKQTVFWLAYDTAAKARQLFEGGDAQQIQTTETLMSTYRKYFPSQSDCFFRGLQAGDSYTVSCGWISGNTTVRPQ